MLLSHTEMAFTNNIYSPNCNGCKERTIKNTSRHVSLSHNFFLPLAGRTFLLHLSYTAKYLQHLLVDAGQKAPHSATKTEIAKSNLRHARGAEALLRFPSGAKPRKLFHTTLPAAEGKVNSAWNEHLETPFLFHSFLKTLHLPKFYSWKKPWVINTQGGKWSRMGSGFANMPLCPRSAARSVLTFEKLQC